MFGAQLKELRTILTQELGTLGKACTEELAGEAATRDAEYKMGTNLGPK